MRRKHAPTLPAHERQPRKLNPIWQQPGRVRDCTLAAQDDAEQSRLAAQTALASAQQAETDKTAMRAKLSSS